MNKKGALFHWIILGLLLATGIFFLNVQDADFSILTPRGEWQFSVLGVVDEAESLLLARDSLLKRDAKEIILDLTRGCGDAYSLVNKCDNVKEKFVVQFKEKWPAFQEVKFENGILMGKGPLRTLEKKIPYYIKYDYTQNFAIDVGFDFLEFEQMLYDAKQLKCADEVCLGENRPEGWKYSICQEDVGEARKYAKTGKLRNLCVESNQKILGKQVKYTFSISLE